MPSNPLKKSVEDVLTLRGSELKDHLAPALEEIGRHDIRELLDRSPDFLSRILNKLKGADAAALLGRTPGAADRLTGLLWRGVALSAGKSGGMKSILEKLERAFRCNIEASDSPFHSHFKVTREGISGGSGLLHFKDEDFRFMGATEVLIELLLGDLAMGFGNLRLKTAGHPGWLRRISPLMGEISKVLKGV
jgi:hypothetical protein